MSTKEMVTCPLCDWKTIVEGRESRIDQSVYAAQWEHVEAAHYKESIELRQLTGDERKARLALPK
jgi:hypothetical protein